MIKTYKRLFDIKYNNKFFSVFLDDKNRRTFLEINEKGHYIYPNLEDFTYLHNLYNNKNPYLKYVSKKRFEEKVRLGTALMVLTAIANTAKFTTIKKTDEGLNIVTEYQTNQEEETIYINDLNVLDSILDTDQVSLNDVSQAINDNPSLTPKYQQAAHEALNKVVEACPNIDLRIFYENIKELQFEELSQEELQAKYNQVSACIDFKEKKIYTYPGVPSNVLCHEFIHAFYNLYLLKGDTIYIRNSILGDFYEEAQTEDLTGSDIEYGSYTDERYFKDYLDTCTNFTLEDYYDKGVWYLIENLENAYPGVDINYCISAIDSRKDTRINDKTELIEEPIPILDELFKICKAKAKNSSNKYEPFGDFAVLVLGTTSSDYFKNYLEEFNSYLTNLGENHLITYEQFEDYYSYCYNFDKFVAVEGEEPFAISGWGFEYSQDGKTNFYYDTIDESNNNLRKIIGGEYKPCVIDIPEAKIIKSIFKYESLIGTESFWQNIAINEQVVSPHLYQKINISLNNEILTTAYIEDLNLKLGLTPSHELGFILSSKKGVLYQSHPDFIRCTANINFSDYLKSENTKYLTNLELNKFLNLEYLYNHEGIYSINFPTLSIANDKYTITPTYNIKIDSVYEVPLRYIFISKNSLAENTSNVTLNYNYQSISLPIDISDLEVEKIYLEDILKHYNKLPNYDESYNFTVEELSNLFTSYVLEIKSPNLTK